MKQLLVYLQGSEVGILAQNREGNLSFAYRDSWLNNPKARPLSQSLPLQEEKFSERECVGFFGGLLPEEYNREIIAKNLGITPRNDFAMLREIGGECAGSVSLMPPGEKPIPATNRYEPISEGELIALLDQLPQRPLLAGKAEIRLSLAGAQNKVALRVNENGFAIPLHESPSTHILKPELERFPGLVENEAYCLHLATKTGLPTCEAEPRQFGPHNCLLITRYDRILQNSMVVRLHQEDFCQALGIPTRIKYQSEGGPGLAECFELVRTASASPARDLIQLFNAVLFNFLTGNNDAHGKNFSLLYSPEVDPYSVRLAPLYDLVSTACYSELSPKMAMKIGKTDLPAELRLRDWEKYWESIGFSPNQARKQTLQFADSLEELCCAPDNDTQQSIDAMIRSRIQQLRKTLT